MRITKTIGFIVLSIIPSAIASASDFDDVVNTIMSNNLSLKYSQADSAAAIEEMKAENVLEAPEFSYENLWGSKVAGDKRNFSVTQSFDWPGVYSVRNEAVRKSETALQYLRESEAIEVRRDIRVALIDLINVRQRISTTSKICDGFGKMVEYFKEAVAKGEETRLDYNKAVVEHINAVRELKSLKSEEKVILSSLRALNGDKPVEELVGTLGAHYPHADLASLRPDRETLRLKDPGLAASRTAVDVQQSLVKVEKRSLLPGFSVGYLHEWENGETFNGFSISVTLPFLTQRHKVKAAEKVLAAKSLDEDMALIKLVAELQSEYETAVAYKELLDEYRGVMDDDSNFELLKKAFDVGQINFLTYMQEMNYFLNARRDFLEIHYRYHLALVRLQRYN